MAFSFIGGIDVASLALLPLEAARKGKNSPAKISHYEFQQKWNNDSVNIIDLDNNNNAGHIQVEGDRTILEFIDQFVIIIDSNFMLYIVDASGYDR